MAFQVRFFRWQAPRYNGIRWAQMVFVLGPLELYKVTVEPNKPSVSGEEAERLFPATHASKTQNAKHSLGERLGQRETAAPPVSSRRVGVPVSTDLPTRNGSSEVVPKVSRDTLARLERSARPAPSVQEARKPLTATPTKKKSPYLDDNDLDLLATLLCEDGDLRPGKRKG